MIKSDFIAYGMAFGAILSIVGILLATYPMTVTAQNMTTDILTSTRGIHNTTSHGDTIVLRGIGSSEEPAHLANNGGSNFADLKFDSNNNGIEQENEQEIEDVREESSTSNDAGNSVNLS